MHTKTILCIAILTLIAVSGCIEGNEGTLVVNVTYSNGQTIENAKVLVKDVFGQTKGLRYTNEYGTVSFQLAAGVYDVSASINVEQPEQTKKATIIPNNTTAIEFDFKVQYHYECQNQQCVRVEGAGDNLCKVDADCINISRVADANSEFASNLQDKANCTNQDCIYNGSCFQNGTTQFLLAPVLGYEAVTIKEYCNGGKWYDCQTDSDCKLGAFCSEGKSCVGQDLVLLYICGSGTVFSNDKTECCIKDFGKRVMDGSESNIISGALVPIKNFVELDNGFEGNESCLSYFFGKNAQTYCRQVVHKDVPVSYELTYSTNFDKIRFSRETLFAGENFRRCDQIAPFLRSLYKFYLWNYSTNQFDLMADLNNCQSGLFSNHEVIGNTSKTINVDTNHQSTNKVKVKIIKIEADDIQESFYLTGITSIWAFDSQGAPEQYTQSSSSAQILEGQLTANDFTFNPENNTVQGKANGITFSTIPNSQIKVNSNNSPPLATNEIIQIPKLSKGLLVKILPTSVAKSQNYQTQLATQINRLSPVLQKYDASITSKADKVGYALVSADQNNMGGLEDDLRSLGYKVYKNGIFTASLNDSIPLIKADEVWQHGISGKDVNIAIIDTGISFAHGDVNSKIVAVADFINEGFKLDTFDVLCGNLNEKTFDINNEFAEKPLTITAGAAGWVGTPENCEATMHQLNLNNSDLFVYDGSGNLLKKSDHPGAVAESIYFDSVPNVPKLKIKIIKTGTNSCEGGPLAFSGSWLNTTDKPYFGEGIFENETTDRPAGVPVSLTGKYRTGYLYLPNFGDIPAILSNTEIDARNVIPQELYDNLSLDLDKGGIFEKNIFVSQYAKIRTLADINGEQYYFDLFSGLVGRGDAIKFNGKTVWAIKNYADVNEYSVGSFDAFGLDMFGHGTHVASIAAGTGQMSGGIYKGVAPQANLIPIKVLNSQGEGTFDAVDSGIIWAADHGAKVINMSLGTHKYDSNLCKEGPVYDAVQYALDKNIIIVVAAGNSGPSGNTIELPGCIEGVITAGSTTKTDQLADYSSRGPTPLGKHKPDIVAPGSSIAAARSFYRDPINNQIGYSKIGSVLADNSNYVFLNGTSMATPHVAGLAALMLSKNPYLTPIQVKQAMMSNAVNLNYLIDEQGAGRIDANASTS